MILKASLDSHNLMELNNHSYMRFRIAAMMYFNFTWTGMFIFGLRTLPPQFQRLRLYFLTSALLSYAFSLFSQLALPFRARLALRIEGGGQQGSVVCLWGYHEGLPWCSSAILVRY